MMMNKKLGIYIHIPFCVKKCNYCDFLSFPADEDIQKKYIEALIQEMDNQKLENDYIVNTVFIGGGTPSILKGSFADSIFMALRKKFKISETAEITMDCNPGTVSKDNLLLYRSLGVNRLSFGLQSADNYELSLLGRIHTWEDLLTSFDMAREAGFCNINIDLMSAIPAQTPESYEKTCEKVLTLQPEHISAYSLIVEEGTPFYENYKDNPPVSEKTDRLLYAKTKEILQKKGYHRYEISNYAKKGYECAHNIKYWSREEYLGLGLGASSLLGKYRLKNVSDMNTYLMLNSPDEKQQSDAKIVEQTGRKKSCYEEIELLDKKDEMSEYMFLGLRKMEGVSEIEFQKLFGKSISEVYPGICQRLIDVGLLKRNKGLYSLTEKGIDISNYVMSEFIL